MDATTPQRRHESPELGGAARRMMRALVRRAAEGDTEALEQLASLQLELQAAIQAAGKLMHSGERMADGKGYSFTELADVLGISRQAARQRFQWSLSGPATAYYMQRPAE